MLLTFNVLYDKLVTGEKLQTIRYTTHYWLERWRRRNLASHLTIWWRSPRTRRYHPDCYMMGIGKWTEFFTVKGSEFTQELAERDGFNSVEEMIREIAFRNKMQPYQVLMHEWAVIRWRWIDGPRNQISPSSSAPHSQTSI